MGFFISRANITEFSGNTDAAGQNPPYGVVLFLVLKKLSMTGEGFKTI